MAEGGFSPRGFSTGEPRENARQPRSKTSRGSRNKNAQPGKPKGINEFTTSAEGTGYGKYSKHNAQIAIQEPTGRSEHRAVSKSDRGDTKAGFTTSVDVHVSGGQLRLLEMIGFANTTATVSIVLDEGNNTVTMTAKSPHDITEEKLRLHEQLEQICERKERIAAKKAELLSRKKTTNRIADICKKKGLQVVVEVSVKQNLLRCLAFTEDEAKEGLDLIKNKLLMAHVRLKPGQLDLIQDPKWSDLLEQLKDSLGMAYLSEDSAEVTVEGFTRPVLETTRQKIVAFLKENVVRLTTKLELNGAKAKCFQTFIRNNLEKKISALGGCMKVEMVQSEPLSLSVSVEGEESTVKEAKQCLDQICSETLDLRDMTPDGLLVHTASFITADLWLAMIVPEVADQWLTMKGLAGEHGRPFLRRFEKDNSCVIDVVEDGLMQPPGKDVKQGRVLQRQRSYSDPSPESERRPHKSGRRRGQGLGEYQPRGLTEDEAFQMALEQSQEVEQGGQDVVFDSEGSDDDQPVCAGLVSPRNNPASDLRPGHGMSVYQPNHMSEHESLQRALSISVDSDQSSSSSDEDGILSSPRRDYSRPSHQASPRRPSHKGAPHDAPGRHGTARQGSRNWRPSQPTCGIENTGFRMAGRGAGSRQSDDYQFSRRTSESGDTVSIAMHGAKVVLHRGRIANFKADSLVNIVGPAMVLDESTVSKSFLSVGGQQLNKLFQQSTQQGVSPVIVTQSCGDLLCKSVNHVVLEKGAEKCAQSVNNAVIRVLDNCVQCHYQSVAFPPLGVGRMYQYDATASAKAMLKATEKFFAKNKFNVVTFVIYEKDDSVFNAFKRVFNSWETEQCQPQVDVEDLMRAQLENPMTPLNRLNLLQWPLKPLIGKLFAGKDANRGNSPRTRQSRLSRQNTQGEDSSRRPTSADGSHRHCNSNDAMTKGRATKEESRFPPESPVKNLIVRVYAETAERCARARTRLASDVTAEFLFEEHLKKSPAVTPGTKQKIVNVLTKHGVKSIKGPDGYTIKGHKESVRTAVRELLQVIVDNSGDVDRSLHDKRQRRKRAGRETPEYVRYMVQEEPDVPGYWRNFKPGQPVKSVITDVKMFVKDNKHVKVKLDSSDPINNAILNMINKTWDPSTRGIGQDAKGLDQCNYTKLHVTKIERIENLDLYQEYSQKRVKMFTQLNHKGKVRYPELSTLRGCTGTIQSVQHADTCLLDDMNSEINEFYFFHGTLQMNVRAICDSGLDNRLANGSAMFGQGIYGAETPSKADQYVDDKGNRTAGRGRTKQMFLMRMILGNAFICTDTNPHKYKRPPCTKCQRDDCRDHTEMYDSVVGDNRKLFREFVVYDKELCYPEYLISYERR